MGTMEATIASGVSLMLRGGLAEWPWGGRLWRRARQAEKGAGVQVGYGVGELQRGDGVAERQEKPRPRRLSERLENTCIGVETRPPRRSLGKL